MTTTPALTFHKFRELPYELRHLIYDFASPPRILHFRTNDDLDSYVDLRRPLEEHFWLASQTGCAPPVTLSINQESRHHALARYQALHAPHEGLMVDPERDLWWIEHRNRDRPDYTQFSGNHIPDGSFGLAEEDKKLVKNVLLVLPNTEWRYLTRVPTAVGYFAKTMGEVREVFVASRELGGIPQPHGSPWPVEESLTARGWLDWLRSEKKRCEESVACGHEEGRYGHMSRTEHVRLHTLEVKDLGI